ncbi:MAG TPA: hypothetical protein ENH84_04415 [Phycisphaerae bacterium]|nr:hypothetical protein [Phycisphaerae bacterium]
MRFVALFKKELREAAPWIILAALVMLLICGGLVNLRMRYMGGEPPYWRVNPGRTVTLYNLFRRSELADCGPVILLTTAGLGVVLAARQFLMPISLKTWAFTIHRSASPISILLAKVAAAIVALCLGVGAVWTVLFFWASKPGALSYVPRTEVLGEGWLMVALGMVVYFGTALTFLSTARWYTTRIFPLAFATGIFILAIAQSSTAWFVGVMILGLVILASQVVHVLLNREF